MSNKSNLNIVFDLDENQIPDKISWESLTDSKKSKHDAKAAFLSFWDRNDENAMSLNLWTKDISIEEMSKFYFQTFITMADNFEKATGPVTKFFESDIFEGINKYTESIIKSKL